MVYLASTLIALTLYFIELSLFPHFLPIFSVPFLFLPFISILSMKDRSIYPVIIAGIIGVLTDSITDTTVPIFSIAYVSIAIISKFFLSKYESYSEFRANLISISIGILVIYGAEIILHFRTLTGWTWLLPFLLNIVLTLFTLIVYVWLGRNFFAWVEKKTEERFR